MRVKVTVEILKDATLVGETAEVEDTQTVLAQGEIVGELDLKRGRPTQPVLTIRMGNILNSVQETIYKDSQGDPVTA